MNILFITSSRIGDAVLSTGLLSYMAQKWPDAKVTIACAPLVASLFEGYPNLERIITLKKEKRHGHWVKLWKGVVGKRWDIVVDLRNSAVSRLVIAGERYIFGPRIDRKLHKVEQAAAVMCLDSATNVPAPKLWFTEAQMEKARALIPAGERVIGVGPAANWIGKTWPAERFITVLQWLTAKGGVYEGAKIAVFGAPGEEEACNQVLVAMGERGIDAVAKGTPAEAAAMISLCDFYLGNDSGLMHCAAACGLPTFGLFGPSYPHLYAPWGAHTAYARTPETFDELIAYEGYTPQTAPCLMESLTVETVKRELAAFLDTRKALAV
jgi:lipopolysaccharide export system permease protein